MYYKKINKYLKTPLLLLFSIIFLTACESNSSFENTKWDSKTQDFTKEKTLEDKINNKQKYIVIQQYNYDQSYNSKNSQNFIEESSNYMFSKNYELKQQTITFSDIGNTKYTILTFEYKGD